MFGVLLNSRWYFTYQCIHRRVASGCQPEYAPFRFGFRASHSESSMLTYVVFTFSIGRIRQWFLHYCQSWSPGRFRPRSCGSRSGAFFTVKVSRISQSGSIVHLSAAMFLLLCQQIFQKYGQGIHQRRHFIGSNGLGAGMAVHQCATEQAKAQVEALLQTRRPFCWQNL